MSRSSIAILLVLATIVPLWLPLAPTAAAVADPLPRYQTYAGPSDRVIFPEPIFGFVDSAGEPSVGVNWNTGEILYQDGFRTFRVTLNDDGTSSWLDVSAPNTPFNIDPYLYTDSETGRTWAGGLDGTCSSMGITDDGGRSWIPAGNMCVATLDHESLASGPWASPRPTSAVYDRATYYCAQAEAVTCITSLDGGLTWLPPTPVECGFADPAQHGSILVGHNGHLYVPFKNCGGSAGFAVSSDDGVTFTAHPVPGAAFPGHGFDADVAATPSGWTYIAYANGTQGAPTVSLTKNDGASWEAPNDLGASVGVVGSAFPEVVAGDDERAAVAFLGTTTPGNGFDPAFTGTWDLYIATTYDAGHTWSTQKVSTDPVQRGWICDGGTGCSAGRDLLDFIDEEIDAQGRVLVAYADGCIDHCAGPDGGASESTAGQATITRQATGLSLFSRFDATNGALFATANGPYTAQPATPVALSAQAANGAAPYAFSWSVLTRPQGSAASAASFSDATSAAPTFTPDITGTYTLRLEARDAAGGIAVDLARVDAVVATGVPVPTCSIALATDVAGDSTSGADGAGRRDITLLSASDAPGSFTLCATVPDMSAAASSGTKFTFGWDAPYEAPGVSYTAFATVTAAGLPSNAGFAKGVAGETVQQGIGGGANATIVGNTIEVRVPKGSIGAPANGASATNLFVQVGNTATPQTTWDRAPDGAGASYTFGQALADTTPPSQVSGLTATDDATGGAVSLAWNAATDDINVHDYVVERSTLPGGPYRSIGLTTGLSYHDTSLTDGAPYYYAVAARDGAGNIGARSAEASVTPTGPGDITDTTAPSAPGSLAANATTANAVELVWTPATDAESGIDHYNVYQDGAFVAKTALLTLKISTLVPSTTYTFDVRAVNGAGLEGPAATLTLTTPAAPPDCGAVLAPYTLVTDARGDSTRGDARSDIIRVGLNESNNRLAFRITVEDIAHSAPATMFRVSWDTDSTHGFAAYVRVTDAGASPQGLWLTTPAGQEVNTEKQPQFGILCNTVLISIAKSDVLNPSTGSVLNDLRIEAAEDATNPAPSQILDAAPDTGGVNFVLGSST